MATGIIPPTRRMRTNCQCGADHKSLILIDIAITKPGIALSQRWSYFCGVCWNMVREIEDDARAVIAAGAAVEV